MILDDFIKNGKVDIEKCYQIIRKSDDSKYNFIYNPTNDPFRIYEHKCLTVQPSVIFEAKTGIKGISKQWVLPFNEDFKNLQMVFMLIRDNENNEVNKIFINDLF